MDQINYFIPSRKCKKACHFALFKQVYQNVEEDSSETSEADSSEEIPAQSQQPELTGTLMPNVVEEDDSMETEQEQEESETSAASSTPETTQEIEVPLNGSNPEAAGLQVLPDGEASPQPQVNVNDVSSTKDLLTVTTTPLPFSQTMPFVIPIGATLAGTPVCFTVQLTTPETAPLRGDSY